MNAWKILPLAVACAAAACSGKSMETAASDAGHASTDAGGGEAASSGPLSLSVSGVAMFQAVKADLVKAGAAVAKPNAPVIAGRPGMLRVYVSPGVGWQPRQVAAELHLAAGGADVATLQQALSVAGESSDDVQGSTFDFDVDATQLPAGVGFRVHLTDPAHPEVAPIDFPADGSTFDMAALPHNRMRVTLVPFEYDADGSKRVPATTPAVVATYHDAIFRMYPVARVDVDVHAVVPTSVMFTTDGTAWTTLIDQLVEMRLADAVPTDDFMIGLVEPMPTYADVCSGPCVWATGAIGTPTAAATHVSVALGYGDPTLALAAIARNFGRRTVACPNGGGTQIDASYPYAGGAIGGPAYDVIARTFLDPKNGYTDFMSNCRPWWVSDYTFSALANQIRGIPHVGM